MAARLNGKVALISGTGSGMGRAAARLFAAEGAIVVGTDVNADSNSETAELVRKDGYAMTSIAPLDISEPVGGQAWIDAAVDQHSGIDILYNNAGNTRFGSFPDVSVEDYEFTIRNELGITWHSTQAAWPYLISRGGGTVLMCGSIAGINGSRDLLQATHVAAKGAVIALTRQLAAEGAAHGISVNSVSPGLIATPTIRQILLNDVPEMLLSMVNRTYNHRPGNAEEVAAAALFLVSDESSYLSGANLVVDGGPTVLI